jgi:sulfite exporter TauE/SafE
MLAFGLGTLPNLLAAGWIASRARGILDARLARFAAAALIGAFAVAGLWRATVAGALAPGAFCL